MLIVLAALSPLFFLFYYNNIQNEKDARVAISVIERNNMLMHKILIEAIKLNGNNENNKQNLKDLSLLYDFSLYSIKNGGVVPEFSNEEIILPPPDNNKSDLIKNCEKKWVSIKEKIDFIIKEEYFIYINKTKDSILDGQTKEITYTERIKNENIAQSVNFLNDNFSFVIEINNVLKKSYLESIDSVKSNLYLIVLILIFLYLFSLSYLVYLLFIRIRKPIEKLSENIKEIFKANNFEDEITKSDFYLPVKKSIHGIADKLNNISEFIKDINNENFEKEIIDFDDTSSIDIELSTLKNKLLKRKQDETQRVDEEEKRKWIVTGQSEFNEILRHATDDISNLSDAIIKKIVLFLSAAQGGLFIVSNEEKETLDLVSAFAYDRKKFLSKKIKFGDGIIGMCAVEKNTVWMKKIPSDYLEIESGLGNSRPKNILIVPLKTENELLGIVEIATLNEFKLHEVEFVENIANSIASSIETTRISQKTSELLRESQKKSEELAIQDSEMRQKIEELRKAHDEAARREAEIKTLIQAVDSSLIKIEMNKSGKITSSNKLFRNLSNYHEQEFLSYNFADLTEFTDIEFKNISGVIFNGQTYQDTIKLKAKTGKMLWIVAQFAPQRDEKEQIVGILFLGNDITSQKEIEEKNQKLLQDTMEKAERLSQKDKQMTENYEKLKKIQSEIVKKESTEKALISAIDKNLITAEFDTEGVIITANELFIEKFKYAEDEIIGSNFIDFVPEKYKENFLSNWEEIIKGHIFGTITKQNTKTGEVLWLETTFTPVVDDENNVKKIIYLASDITDKKNAESELERKSEEIKKTNEKIQLLKQENDKIKHNKSTDKYNKEDNDYFNWVDNLFNE